MKQGVHTIISLILIVMITIVAVSVAYYWITKIQGNMQSGTSEYQHELTSHVTGRLSIVDFQYNVNTKNAKIVIENSGSRKVEDIGSIEDTLIITSKDSSCDLGFNSSNCDVCPLDLDVGEIRVIYIGFTGTTCANVEEGTEYDAYFALRNNQIMSSFVAASVNTTWEMIFPTSKPSTRHKFVMSTIDGTDKVILFGGNDGGTDCDGSGSQYCNATWVYDLSDKDWTQKSPASKPSARQDTAMATINNTNKVVLFGGWNGSRLNDTWVYNYSDDNWYQMSPASKPNSTSLHAMANIDEINKTVLFGGYTSGDYSDETWIYNLSDNKWYQMNPASKPNSRTGHTMTTIDGTDKIVLFGGWLGGWPGGPNDETWVYDYSDNDWTQMSPASKPSIRESPSMSTIYGSDKVLLFGGIWVDVYYGDTWIYDYNDNTWIQMNPASKPSARSSHAIATINNTDTVVLFGGSDSDGRDDETWVYHF